MIKATAALIEYLHNMGLDRDVDLLCEIVRAVSQAVRMVSQALMELEVEQTTGAAKYGCNVLTHRLSVQSLKRDTLFCAPLAKGRQRSPVVLYGAVGSCNPVTAPVSSSSHISRLVAPYRPVPARSP